MEKENRHFIYIPAVVNDPGEAISFSACEGRIQNENLDTRAREILECKNILPRYQKSCQTNYRITQSSLNSNNNNLSFTNLGESSKESPVLRDCGRVSTGCSNDNFTHKAPEKEPELLMCGSPESGIECDDTSSTDMAILRDEFLRSDSTEYIPPREISRTHVSNYLHDNKKGAGEQVEEDGEMKILSVHSLASVSKCMSNLKEEKKSVSRDPLTKCNRLYIRRIKGFCSVSKNVLVLEADYNSALSYSKLKNTPKASGGNTNVPKANICAGIQSLKRGKCPKFVAEPKVVSDTTRERRNEKPSTVEPWTSKVEHVDSDDRPHEKGTGGFSAVHSILNESLAAPNIDSIESVVSNEDTGCEAWRDFMLTPQLEECSKEDFFRSNRSKRKKQHSTTSTSPKRSKRVPENLLSPQINRINELKEKLRQKEADLENIRRNMSTLKSVEDL